MYSQSKPGMQCAEFDALLWEALDGSLGAAEMARFQAHRTECASCGPMFAEAHSGRTFLRALDQVEPPANLVHNIMVATVGRVEAAPVARPRESWWERLRGSLRPVLGPALQPKFVMSFAMAFFSITLLLNVAGIDAGELKHLDLRPSALVRGYYETQGRLVKYYENIRFVYEIESRVQQLKRATTPEDKAPAPEHKDRKDKGGEPDRKYQNYSREQEGVTIARHFERMLENEFVPARRLS
jgi:Putative zinc-finger